MAAVPVSIKELLSCYLIVQKIKEKMDAGIPSYSQDNQQHQPSNALHIENNAEPESQKEAIDAGIPSSDWIISVKEKLERVKNKDVPRREMWPKLCIYKVPQYMKVREDKAYTPKLVSLGPYHHGKKGLRNMESHKWRAFCQILKRCNKEAELFLDSIKEVEKNVRECYEGEISMKSNEFVEMMVLDGCFVLELFQGAAAGFINLGYSEDDPVFAKRDPMLYMIQRDMIMLENQIPLFVLERLLGLQTYKLGLQTYKSYNVMGVKNLALLFFDSLMRGKLNTTVSSKLEFDPLDDKPHLHCLNLFRRGLLWERSEVEPKRSEVEQRTQNGDEQPQLLSAIHCVTELKEAGVKFKKRDTNIFWDIEFKNGVLEIPPLSIHHGTKSLFLNLIAFEQLHLHCGNEITSYVILMDNLINSQEDVRHLHNSEIFEPLLGSDIDVADLFNQLCHEFDFHNEYPYHYQQFIEVDRFYKQFYDDRWNRWKAILMHNYFSNPWSIMSLIAAVMLLFLTFLQAFFGVFGYFKPPS